MGATKYDASIIQEFADRLYRQADQIVYTYGLGGFLLGGIGGTALGSVGSRGEFPLFPALFGALIFCALFAAAGRARAFTLRLQAQTALCQAEIERNSRTR